MHRLRFLPRLVSNMPSQNIGITICSLLLDYLTLFDNRRDKFYSSGMRKLFLLIPNSYLLYCFQ